MDLALYKEFREECDAAYPESVEIDSDPPRRRPRGLAIYPPHYAAGFFISSECVYQTFKVPPPDLLGLVNDRAWKEKRGSGVNFSMIQVTHCDYLVCFAHTVDDKRDMQEWRERRDEWFDTFCRMLELNEASRTILKRNYKWHRLIYLDKSVGMPPDVSLQSSTVLS
ncbi:hypothetical protein CC1G_02383 [Coprinopsis cinerea okayama7|uniref:Uncharacterized protein n=1 Tax=Coprinopsis cinerea (strain Okayama-7 / 130 / ATCC MYA-4618 / FGSC 9003) TaxID=240176 RepID=A8N7X6_COPC7|nr:hypothetical protein CC1G_02383 [Coprinopsis cinerea okayama7\|eukprot:XP_001830932.1 hypothetical protein CC1G_02383 [Coprinopsis cinerea okayama7\